MASKVCNAARASLVRILSRHPQRITIADLRPWDVVIYPRNGDTSGKIAAYITGLSTNQFDKIAAFFAQQATRMVCMPLPGARSRLVLEATGSTQPLRCEGRGKLIRAESNYFAGGKHATNHTQR